MYLKLFWYNYCWTCAARNILLSKEDKRASVDQILYQQAKVE